MNRSDNGCALEACGRGHYNAPMPTTREENAPDSEVVSLEWFRAPSRREHWIAAGLFVGFGVFFVLLSVVNRGWWFGWVILLLGVWSLAHALGHALDARRTTSREGAER